MSRTVREQEKMVLDKLRKYVPEEMVCKIADVKRGVQFARNTYDVIERADIVYSSELQENKIALLHYKNCNYICVKEELCNPNVIVDLNFIDDKELLFGAGILLFNKNMLQIKKNITGYQIFDRFFGYDEDKRYDCDYIFEVIDDYVLFEIKDDDFIIQYHEDLDRLLYMMFFGSGRGSRDKLELGLNIFAVLELESSRSLIPMFENIAQTDNNELIFLQLYRCIEYLYIIHRAIEFSTAYNLQKEKVLEMLDTEKIWFSENNSIYQIIKNYSSEDVIDEYCVYIREYVYTSNQEPGDKMEMVARYVYNTRCKIAHFKYGQEKIEDKSTLNKSNIVLSKLVNSIF